MPLISHCARRQREVLGKRLGFLPMNYLSQMSSSVTRYMPLGPWLDNLPLSGGRIRMRAFKRCGGHPKPGGKLNLHSVLWSGMAWEHCQGVRMDRNTALGLWFMGHRFFWLKCIKDFFLFNVKWNPNKKVFHFGNAVVRSVWFGSEDLELSDILTLAYFTVAWNMMWWMVRYILSWVVMTEATAYREWVTAKDDQELFTHFQRNWQLWNAFNLRLK